MRNHVYGSDIVKEDENQQQTTRVGISGPWDNEGNDHRLKG
jgi:hypothetical protein